MPIKSEKIIRPSRVLARDFHFDLPTPEDGSEPEFLHVHFGGSGITPSEYERRAKGVNPVLAKHLSTLLDEFPFALAFVTAPYDLAYARIEHDEDIADVWNQHFYDELMPELPDLPFFVSGFSGGMALALSGPHQHARCFGAGGIGPDDVPESLAVNRNFIEPIACIYNLSDRVYSENKKILEMLEKKNLVQVVQKLPGGHDFKNYLRNQSFAGLVRRAKRLL